MARVSLNSVQVGLILLTGCVGAQQNSTLEAIQSAFQPAAGFTSMSIEYPGPDQKWAGPPSFAMEVDAKGETTSIKISPPELDPSSSTTISLHPKEAREYFKYLAGKLESAPAAESTAKAGCASTVRVRLVRSDGSVMEKRACRSAEGWPHVASTAVDFFLSWKKSPDSGPGETPEKRSLAGSGADQGSK